MLVPMINLHGVKEFDYDVGPTFPTIAVPVFIEGKAYVFGTEPPNILYRDRIFKMCMVKMDAFCPLRPVYFEII